MTAFAIRRKDDHRFLGTISSPLNDLFNRIDDECDPYGVEFSRSKLSDCSIIWEQFKYINEEYAEIEQACIERSTV